MFLRCRINKLIHILEKNDSDTLTDVLNKPKYQKALQALDDMGCVKIVRDMSGAIHMAWLLDHYATYQLDRQDVWLNRFWGFVFGVATSVLTALITGILHI